MAPRAPNAIYLVAFFLGGLPGTEIRNFCWGDLPKDFGVDGGGGGAKFSKKMPKYLVLKGSKNFEVPAAPRKKSYIPYFSFFISNFPIILQFFKNITKIF